ncbi:hypothetical protein NEPTK9_000523 [Candidatus Neptunochlamydia vexilliferae]|uniref:Uncharacterized protein n=1 Tax=Candidatus Neptunichlamydia vexilliferae TaxID=1651774 RepID=A0ABS0AY13_9BACT|nr:hypothetical protein [Candidatus Neptunochlamydia vexilliferae]
MRRGQAPCCPHTGRFCRAILKPRTAHRMAFLRLRLRSHVSSLESFLPRKPCTSFTKEQASFFPGF